MSISKRFVLALACLAMLACATTREASAPAPAASAPARAAAPPAPVATTAPRTPAEAFTLPAANPVDAAKAPDNAALPRDPDMRAGVLPNGLRWFVRQNAKPAGRVELRLAVDAGSVLEDEDQRGLAHFVEHMAFNGTKNFKKQELIDYLEGIGMRFGPDLNAYTSFDETVYLLQVPTDDQATLEKAFLILQDWAQGLAFDPVEIDKERGVVLEEWRQGRGAGARIRDKQFPVLLNGSRYAERLPIGQREIIESGSHDALRRFYRDWYRPNLMGVVAVGDLDPARLAGLIEKYFAPLQNPASPRERPRFEIPAHDEALASVATDREQTLTTVSLYLKRPERSEFTHGDYRRSIVEDLAFAMINERLVELSEKADPPFINAFAGAGRFIRGSEVTIANVLAREGQVERGLETALVEVERAARHGFTATELERGKAERLRGMEVAFAERDKEESDGFAGEYVSHFLTGTPSPGIAYELELHRRYLPGITIEEVNRVAATLLDEGSRVVLYSGPEKDGVTHPEGAALLALANAVSTREIAAYVDRVIDAPLVAEPPKPARIVARSVIDAVGVHVWTLENGIRVYLKPTDFQNDEILLRAFSSGGYSLAPEADHELAAYATQIVAESGIGPFDQAGLRRYLAGKQVFARPYVSERYEGFVANGTRQDLGTMFEMIYAWATVPGKDPQAFDSLKTAWREVVRNRLSDPSAIFSDAIESQMWGGHFAHRPITDAVIDGFDLDRAHRFYSDRFADLSDLEVVIVGNIDLQKDEALIATWIGGLPGGGRKESWRDLGDRRREGTFRVDVAAGVEAKSRVRLTWHGPATFSREERLAMTALSEALDIRLREILREDMGGTYGVGVGGGLWKDPQPGYAFDVSFGCAPENVDGMIQAVMDEFARVQREGVSEEIVKKVHEQLVREREVALERNGFWASSILFLRQIDEDVASIASYRQLLDTIDGAMIREAAKRYLTTENRMRAVLVPQG